MGVFKKLTGADVRVTPIVVQSSFTGAGTAKTGTNNIPNSGAANRATFATGVRTDNESLLYNSIRQLFYGAFLEQDFSGDKSIFSPGNRGGSTKPTGVFSRYDPSFQGSGPYSRTLTDSISVVSIPRTTMGESLVPGTISGSGFTDDYMGNLVNSSDNVVGNIFYDQGILVGTNTSLSSIEGRGCYTVYATQYKCTAEPHEFNLTLNPTALSDSTTEYDPELVGSAEFMPYVTTIGLYNENQELMMVAKLSKPVQLNPYTNTNFIVRLDK